ncbi:hypothetical protein HNR39_000894 [Glaciimonas immobilis]|uniref:Transposase IS66 zinc-finger binding domain-containing protein n=1 Tax=Glaciimonas immobilis TaxID=728004 RepID=A0A840RQT7_9BURK|nr:IS66 family transposase [Glaciimonas immobilis]MBB5199084.1 hypothetical protein [Glaciimonas immobilis]
MTCRYGCQLQRIGEDISEKLNYTPGAFSVERHVRGQWACASCETLIQAPLPAQVIEEGIPAAALLAQALVAGYAYHPPPFIPANQYLRARPFVVANFNPGCLGRYWGVALRAEMLREEVLYADETPLPMLSTGNKKTTVAICGPLRAHVSLLCGSSFMTLPKVGQKNTPEIPWRLECQSDLRRLW